MIINKCLVAIKKVINPYVAIKIKEDHSGVITDKVRSCINPFDEIALQAAIKLKQQKFINEILVVSIGQDISQDILLQSLASGADRAIFIKTEQALTSLNVAKILQHLIIVNKINVAFLGKQTIDHSSNQVAQMLAGLLRWPQVCLASNVNFTQNSHDQQLFTVDKLTDFGVETWEVQLPVVVNFVDSNIELSNNNAYISVQQLMQAKKKTIDILLLQDLHINNLKFANVKVVNTYLTPIKSASTELFNVAELIDILKNKVM